MEDKIILQDTVISYLKTEKYTEQYNGYCGVLFDETKEKIRQLKVICNNLHSKILKKSKVIN